MAQRYLFAFDATTGALISTFRPTLSGGVYSIEPGPTAGTAYVGGAFSTVNGAMHKGIIELNTSSGAIVNSFAPPTMNGIVNTLRVTNGHLLIGGTFTKIGANVRNGLASLNPTTGALDSYVTVALTGHHNYTGEPGQADGAVGASAMSISPDGTQAVVLGNFKDANGVVHDQIAKLVLGSTSASLDTSWNTAKYTATCKSKGYDSYVRDVDYSPDGSYFVVAATGGSGTNSDHSRSLCDAAARWSSTDSGSDVAPTWIDYTGNDTLLSVAVTGTAVYVGGHERWLNNPNGSDSPGAGAVPRPGLAALDPANGLPLKWNPGRNPRGDGAYVMFASSTGLYVGSDTDYIGNRRYKHMKLAYFPLSGGSPAASTSTQTLPANVYEVGQLPNAKGTNPQNSLTYRPMSSTMIGNLTTLSGSGVAWGSTRGAVAVGSTIFYGDVNGNFWQASFDGTNVGRPIEIDPYDDPAWDNVQTGSGQTYRGTKSGYYAELPKVTGAFYSDGRLYYTLTGSGTLHWRYFAPDSGIVGGQEYSATGHVPSNAGMFMSGTTLYYANRTDGTLHTISFSNGGTNGPNPAVDSSHDTTISGPNIDGDNWNPRSLFAFGKASFPDGTKVSGSH